MNASARWASVARDGPQKDGQIIAASFDSNYLDVHSVSREAESDCEQPSNQSDDTLHIFGVGWIAA